MTSGFLLHLNWQQTAVVLIYFIKRL